MSTLHPGLDASRHTPQTARPRTLLVISARLDDAARAAVASGRWPRKDFIELAHALDADVIDYDTVERRLRWRALRRVVGMWRTQVWIAFTRRHRYHSIFTDGEHLGVPLALLLRLTRHRPRHVTIGHLVDTPVKRAVFRWLRPQRAIDVVLVHGALQRRLAHERLGLPLAGLALVPYQVDPQFWRPARTPQLSVPRTDAGEGDPSRSLPSAGAGQAGQRGPLICTVGLEYRDYPTLLAAVRGLPVRLVIAAGSHWSRHRNTAEGADVPANVEVTTLDYVALRDLYARARFVVVPLREIDNPAGITVILEAMAMGKAVIVTATSGQRDTIRGRLCTADGLSAEPQGGPAAFGVTGALAEAETGLYVPPGDAAAMRRAIQYLLDHPDEAERMGAAGRRLLEGQMSLDLFVRRLGALIAGTEPPVAGGGVQLGDGVAPAAAAAAVTAGQE